MKTKADLPLLAGMLWPDNMRLLVSMAAALVVSTVSPCIAAEATVTRKIPVILSTDIGDDIDDTWALGFLLKSPELDLKLALGDHSHPEYRAKLIAKFLQRAGRTDVPVGLGVDVPKSGGKPHQAEWVKDYDLAEYPGRIYRDGVQAMIDLIMESPEMVSIIAIGPTPNVAAALAREPRIAARARFVGMYGSVRVGYRPGSPPTAESNVKSDPKSCQRAFAAPWEKIITPLDTCGLVHLRGEKYRQVCDSRDPVAIAIIENYRIRMASARGAGDTTADTRSTTLFDTVAVYLAFDRTLCQIETLGIRVTNDGFTRIDPAANRVSVATGWTNLGGFEDLLVARLTGSN
ncbi:MAG: nucleoside hydrolase [Verrucomicrobia bacterium]|nr:nucleoside hydrolase [Verrucomicrobiota bacterium]